MILQSNVHTHTTWCDGMNTPMEMAEAAYALGFTDLGFSSHAFEIGDPALGIPLEEEAGYKADVAKVKEAFAGRMGVLCGIERDTLSPSEGKGYDYIIGSNHYLPPQNGDHRAVDVSTGYLQRACQDLYSGNWKEMVRGFYELSLQNVVNRRPDIVGHFDLIRKYNQDNAVFDEESSFYKDVALSALDEAATAVKAYNGLVEVNMSPHAREPYGSPFPAEFLLRHLAQRDVRVIVTSDSHNTSTLNCGFAKAPGFLQMVGFKRITVLQHGRFIDLPLEV